MCLISVCVPVYKTEKYLSQCVESLLAQQIDSYEIILVDDGSPDNSGKICDTYAEKSDNIKVIHKQNGGLVSARKAGVFAAEGKYICFVDSDDYVTDGFLKSFYDIISEYHPDVVACGFTEVYPDKLNKRIQNIKKGYLNYPQMKQDIYPKMLSDFTKISNFNFCIFPSVWSKCIKKEIVLNQYENLPDNITMGEDVALVYPCLLKAESLYISDNTSYMYRINPESMTNTYNKNITHSVTTLINYLGLNIPQDDQYYDYILCMTINVVFVNEIKRNKNRTDAKKNIKEYIENNNIKKIWDLYKNKYPIHTRISVRAVINGHYFIYDLLEKLKSMIKKIKKYI